MKQCGIFSLTYDPVHVFNFFQAVYEPLGQLGPFCMKPCVSFYWISSQDIHIRLTSDSKLVISIFVNVNGFLSQCNNPVMDWQPVQMTAGIVHLLFYTERLTANETRAPTSVL